MGFTDTTYVFPDRPTPPDRHAKRILVADDDEGVAEMTIAALESEGYDVTSVDEGNVAVDLLKADHGFMLLLLDIGLPGCDGSRVLKRLAEEGAPRPITIVMSAFQPKDIEARMGGAHLPLLAKPFTPTQLVSAVRKYIGAP